MSGIAPNQRSEREQVKRSNTATTLGDFLYGENTSADDHDNRKRIEHPQPLPPVRPDSLIQSLQFSAIKFIACGGFICYLLGRFGFNVFFGVLLAILCAWTYWNIGREAKKGLEWQLEKQEGMKTLYTSEGESVEWLNYMVEKIWRSIDPEFFTLVEDILEDTIQSVAPKFIKAIKVSDFDIGVQAPRIQMIRVFPPLPGQPDESIFGEAAFSFHAHPVASLSTNRSPKSTPPGLSIRFQTAFKAPLDIKAELTAVSGKIRFKILTSPELPFISKTTIAFTSVPIIETSVMPLSKHLNIMNLPTVKMLVNEGVKLGFADLVDPKSMTIDIKALLGPGAIDTAAIGVVKVEIREAQRDDSVKFKDMEDSYASLSLSTQPKKTLTTTRVLTNDKDPRWNENLYVLVSQDDIVSETCVDVKIWDADKVKFDDLWGSVSTSVKDIVQGKLDKLGNVESWCQNERTVYDGWTPIDGKSIEESKVKLNMKMTFHPKYPTPNMDIFTSSSKKKMSSEKQKELETPVDPSHNNGILYVQIHQAMDLEIGDPEVLPTNEEFKHPYDPSKVVNPYAAVYINDNKVYQTREKLRNPSPHWNAISEHFVKDIENTFLRISVKNAVDLERNPVLGTISFNVSEIFEDQDDKLKEIQKWVTLSNGIGFGKLLLTIKYKPVKLTIPKELQGADVGTLIIERVCLNSLKPPFNSPSLGNTKATIALNIDPAMYKRLKPKNLTDQSESSAPCTGWYNQHLYFPLMMRYRTAIYVHIIQGSINAVKATGRFWLKYVPDGEWQDLIFELQPFVSEGSKESNRNEDPWSTPGEFGQITLRVKFVPGFSPIHTHLNSFKRDMIGADPFYKETLKYKAQKWIKSQADDESNNDEQDTEDRDLQEAVQAEKEKQDQKNDDDSETSSYYGDDMGDGLSEEIEEDMVEQGKKNKISKHRVVRKMSLGVDKVKQKVDILKDGFNSEIRANRTVAKEV
ncbi:hypothetical protein K501DRAFT_256031 [Backusella circina FSU 941]|nr:hypothetical protein K501DRAFT_256031 [Backusella circina FSU 941]